mmetsp:Transcript_27486/g.86264  ORF Transcript_27486/g.86264 Transcript_27486/m.86264 type:complete len:203 (-) Transcript_27486:19-627(-)
MLFLLLLAGMLASGILAEPQVTHRVFMELSIGGEPAGRLEIGLFGEHAPKTVENFLGVIKGFTSKGSGKSLGLRGSKLHRIIPGFMAQGGDITRGDGRGGDSIWGGAFDDESFRYKHSRAGRVSMANAGPNTNKSQFFITFKATPHLNGKHVVFGQVEGVPASGSHPVLAKLEAVGSRGGRPSAEVKVEVCGILPNAHSHEL